MNFRRLLYLALALFLSSIAFAWAGEIHDAAAKGDVKKVRLLLQQDKKLANSPGDNNQTPLHYAAAAGKVEAAEILLLKGANLNAKDINDMTPLDLAMRENKKDMILFLKSRGGTFTKVAPVEAAPQEPTKTAKEEPAAKDIKLAISRLRLESTGDASISAKGTILNKGTAYADNIRVFIMLVDSEGKILSSAVFYAGNLEKKSSAPAECYIKVPGNVEYVEIGSSNEIRAKVDGMNKTFTCRFITSTDQTSKIPIEY